MGDYGWCLTPEGRNWLLPKVLFAWLPPEVNRLRGDDLRHTIHVLCLLGSLVAAPCMAQSGTDYAYDALGRLVLSTQNNGTQTGYTYDSAGNRIKKMQMSWPARSANVLYAGQALLRGQDMVSDGGRYHLHVQTDGNLVLYGQSGALWAGAGSHSKVAAQLVMQGDGNLVLYGASGEPLWSSGTNGNPGAWFVVQSDGNMVIYSASGPAIWTSDTACGLC